MKKHLTERELIHERIKATAKALFHGIDAAFVYLVSLPGDDFPELEIPADYEEQAKERYNAVCSIRHTNKTHKVMMHEQAEIKEPKSGPLESVELMETEKDEHRRRRRHGSTETRGGKPAG